MGEVVSIGKYDKLRRLKEIKRAKTKQTKTIDETVEEQVFGGTLFKLAIKDVRQRPSPPTPLSTPTTPKDEPSPS